MSDYDERLAALTPLQRSVMAIRTLRERLDAVTAERTAPIAVVGIGCRFPGSHGPDAFFETLMAGTDAVGPVPVDRWQIGAGDPPHLGSGAFMADVDLFDAGYFGISPREAAVTDPQQRLLLETAIETLEDAGIPPGGLAHGATGVFIGAMTSDYAQLATRAELEPHVVSGIGNCFLAGRIAHVLSARGPALTVDTACSSSLVAIHLAVQALRAGECDLALAGGVNLMLLPMVSHIEDAARMLSPGARCRTFAAGADGIVRGEGVGLVALMRLSDAMARGLRVQAVIRGSAVVHDGESAGLTVPSEAAQRLVIARALAQSGLAPTDISYLEAHGTGTALGDPIELAAAAAVLRAGVDAARPLVIGSVKTNIGHLEAAAGIAAFIKTVLSLSRGEIPPHLHFDTPNPLIPWDEAALEVPTRARDWPDGPTRAAGVSSFGLSGTNAHMVVTAPPPPLPKAPARAPPLVFTLSACDAAALRRAASSWACRIAGDPTLRLADICRTTNEGRAALAVRLAGCVDDVAVLQKALAEFADGGEGTPLRSRPGGAGGAGGDDEIADRWLHGEPIDWAMMYEGTGALLLAMPTYPFARHRHWVKASAPVSTALVPVEKSRLPADLVAALALVEQLGEDGAATQVSNAIAERLARLGPAQRQLLTQMVVADPALPLPAPLQSQSPGADTRLLHDVVWRQVALPARPLRLAGVWLVVGAPAIARRIAADLRDAGADARTGDPGATAPAERLDGLVLVAIDAGDDDAQSLVLLNIIQSFEAAGVLPARLIVVTAGANAVASRESADPACAALWGLAGTVASEYPQIEVRRLDLDAVAPFADLGLLLTVPDEPSLAVRGAKAFAPRLVRRAPMAAPATLFAARADATYLVTGGLGALGLEVAGWLADRGARHLVLIGREPQRPEALERLVATGISVTLRATDVADHAAMAALFAQLAESDPPLRGIIHAAGVLADGILRQQTRESFARVLRPKREGAEVLGALAQRLDLDFFVAFSSLAEVIGSPGQGNYVAANAALTAVMAARRAAGLPGVALRWGPWAQVGMAAAASQRDRDRIERIGIRPIAAQAGLAQLDAVLCGPGDSDPVIVDAEWPTFLAHPAAARLAPLLSELATITPPLPSTQSDWPARVAAAGANRPALVHACTHEAVAQALGMAADALDPAQSLLRLGIDSLMAISLKEVLRLSLAVELDLTRILDGATTNDLAGFLLEQMAMDESGRASLAVPPAASAMSEPIDAARARDLLARIDVLDEAERERLLDQMLREA